ncbi:MAG TPA: glycosyltransferase family protein [Rhodospirillaceae bacterium]|nr:glycosyltransferase family protein [Rhodospirillaceae bacterium]
MNTTKSTHYSKRITEAFQRSDLATAEKLADRYLAAGGGGEAVFLRAMVHAANGENSLALPLMNRAAALLPDRADIAYNYGVVLRSADRLAEATDQWRRAVEKDDRHRDSWNNLALALEDLGDVSAAAEIYGQLLQRWPNDKAALFNFAALCHRNCLFDGAIEIYESLVKEQPDFLSAWINLGMSLKGAGHLTRAEAAYRRALELAPDDGLVHFNLASLLLLQGRWAEGFAEYEWRRFAPDAPKVQWDLPDWTGDEPPGTRLVLWNDQGFGDAIQFIRFAPALAARGYRIFAYVQEPLVPLFAGLPDLAQVVGLSDPPPEADVQCAFSSLPFRLGCTDPQQFWQSAYLPSAPGPLPRPGDSRKKIGLVWAGNPLHANDHFRSASLDDFKALLTLPQICFFSLQKGVPAESLPAGLQDLTPQMTDFKATAAWLDQLDLVITVDTAMAHLAGAMGKEAWILLPKVDCDWRWQAEGERTPWYPRLRLFRQETAGDWGSVVVAMAALLRQNNDGEKT